VKAVLRNLRKVGLENDKALAASANANRIWRFFALTRSLTR
jgi:hypothetical protein